MIKVTKKDFIDKLKKLALKIKLSESEEEKLYRYYLKFMKESGIIKEKAHDKTK